MTIKPGDKIPSATLMHMTDAGPAPISTDELCAGKTVAVFALPGAFTPTCSNNHLPGYIGLASEIQGKGVDTIACLSVNDAFVMGAWGKDQNVGNSVKMVADGNGDFAKACGLEMDGSGFGLGTRMQRCAMIVDNGTVSQVFVEEPGQFEKSTADNILANL